MSFHVFFSFSTGLTEPITAPKGTKDWIAAHVAEIEDALSLKRETCGEGEDASIYWDSRDRAFREGWPDLDQDTLCTIVSEHNSWVRRFYADLADWAKSPLTDGETITPADAATFWHALRQLDLPPERWSRDYYVERMEHLYEVMRGRENEGVTFDVKALTPQQAAAVVHIFDRYLDGYDMRLDVPHGHDHLASSYDGGYDWCGTCGRAMIWEDAQCCRRRKCELRQEADAA